MRALRGATLKATAPDGRTASAKVTGFALTGGRPSNNRLARTGRIDVHVDADGPVSLQWQVTLA